MGSLVGLINFAHQIGGALAVYLFGLVFDISGNYDPAIAASVICLAVAGIVSSDHQGTAVLDKIRPGYHVCLCPPGPASST